MKRRLIAGLLAAVMAVVGAALVLNYVNGADARALSGRNPVEVYVSAKVIPAGTTLAAAKTSGLIRSTKVPADAEPAGVLKQVGPDNGGQVALADIAPGQYLFAAAFGATPMAVKAINVPDGMLAMSVQLSDPARIGQFVTPGSHLTVYATYAIKSTGTDDKSKALNQLNLKGTTVLLPDVQVIAMGEAALSAPKTNENTNSTSDTTKKSTTANDPNNAASFLVTLAVKPADSVRLAHGIAQYTLYAGLRGQGVQVGPNDTTSDFTVFGSKVDPILEQAGK